MDCYVDQEQDNTDSIRQLLDVQLDGEPGQWTNF